MENQNQDPVSDYSDNAVVQPPVSSLEFGPAPLNATSRQPYTPESGGAEPRRSNPLLRLVRRADVILAVLLVLSMIGVLLAASGKDKPAANNSGAQTKFGALKLPLKDFAVSAEGVSFGASSVVINGSLSLNNGLVVSPSLQPSSPKAGQLYFDQDTNELAYYNGTDFVILGAETQASGAVESIGGLSGQVGLAGGLGVVGNQLVNAGVLSLGGQGGAIVLGNGLSMAGNTLQNSGVIGLVAGTDISITDDGNGNFTINNTGAGTGTVTSSGGTGGNIPLFTGAQNIEDSIVSQSGLTVTVGGSLSVTGSLGLGTALSVANGGTGATSLTANGVIVGNGAGALSSVAAGGAGLCLLSTGGAPSWAACPAGTGDDISVNGTGAVNANFLDTAASGTNAAITWNLNGAATPDDITVSIGNASAAAAGTVTTGVQTFAGAKTFNGQITAGAGVSLGTQTLSGTTAVIDFSNFDVSSAGAVTAVGVNAGGGLLQGTGGLTVGGAVTLSSLANGFLEVDGSGVVSVGTINLNTDTTGDYVANLGALTGLTTSGNSGEGSTPTLSVTYGSGANTAVQGNTGITVTAGTNLTGGGSITLGSGGSVTLDVANSPTFSGDVIIQGGDLTLGTATAAGTLLLHDGDGETLTLGLPDVSASYVLTMPTAVGAANQCLKAQNGTGTLFWDNCTGGAGGGLSGSGTLDRVPKFTPNGTTLGDSSISDNGSLVTLNGNVNLSVQGTTVTVGVGSSRTGSIVLQNSTNNNTVTMQSGVTSASYVLTMPTAVGSANQCLKAQNGTGTLFWDNCLGGGGASGITSINSQTGPAITINNAAGSGNAITIDDAEADGSTKGIASFNATNFNDDGAGVINTAQDIDTAAAPSFAGLTLTGNLSLGANTLQGTTAVINFNNFDVASNGDTTIGGTLGVTGLTTLNGNLTIQAGDTFTFNSDAFTDLTGNGLQVSSNALTLALQANKGLEVDANGLSFIDCVSGEILKYNGSNQWACAADNGTGAAPTLQEVYDNDANGSDAIVTLTSTDGAILVRDNATPLGGNLFAVQDNTGATSYLAVDSAGGTTLTGDNSGVALTVSNGNAGNGDIAYFNDNASTVFSLLNGGSARFQNTANSTAAFFVNVAGGAASVLLVDTTNGEVEIGTPNGLTGKAVFGHAGGSNTITLTGPVSAPGAARTVRLPDADGTICLQSSSSCGFATGSGSAFLQDGNSFTAAATLGTNDAFDLNIETGGTTRLTVESDGSQVTFASNVDLVLQGASAFISNPQTGTDTEAFGLNASVGNSAQDALAVGANAFADTQSVSIGTSAHTSIGGAIAIGSDATADADSSIAIGRNSDTGANDDSIAIGTDALTTAANQMVIGSDTHSITHAVIGNGVSSTTPNGFTLQATSGSGSNIAGASIDIAGGQGTGTGNGGSIGFKISAPGGAGSSLNSLTTVGTIQGGTGAVNFVNAVDSTQAFNVETSSGGNLLTVDTSNSRVGVALGAANTPALSNQGLEVNGAIRISGTANDNYTTPDGATITARLSVVNANLGGSAQIIAVGVNSASDATARGITVLDDRAGVHQPSIGVISRDEAQIGGFSWDGSNTAFLIKNSASGSIGLNVNGTTTLSATTSGVDVTGTLGASATSATAFRIQNAGATEVMLTVDTAARSGSGGNLVKVGNSTGTDTALTLLQLDAATADPTSNLVALNGGLFYNSTTNKVSLIENGQVKIICNTTDLGCGTGTVTLQNAYDNGNTITTDASGDIAFTLGNNQSFTVTTPASGTGSSTFSLADGSNATPPSQLVLVTNNDTNQLLANGLAIQAAGGGITDGLDVSDAELVNAINAGDNIVLGGAASIDFTNFDVSSAGNITLGENADHTLGVTTRASNAAGRSLTLQAGAAGAGGSAFVGGNLTLQAGNAAGTGDADGGDVIIQAGNDTGNGETGQVIIQAGSGDRNEFFSVRNSAGNPLLVVNSSNGQLYLGEATVSQGYDITFGNDGTDRTIGVDDSTTFDGDNLTIRAGSSTATNADGGSVILTGGDANGSGVNGIVLVQNITDSAGSFRVQNAAASETMLSVDTTARSGSGGNLIKVGNSTGTDTALTILQLDSTTANPTSNLSALNGGLFYNSTTHKVSLIENGVVKIICNTTDLGCGTGTVTLQNAYTNSTGGSTSEMILDATRGAVDIQDRSTSNGGTIGANLLNVRATAANDSTAGTLLFGVGNTGAVLSQNSANSQTAFQIQNAGGSSIFNISTLNTNLNLLINSNFEANINGWAAKGTPTGGTPRYDNTAGNALFGSGTLNFDTNDSSDGTQYAYQFLPSTQYTASFYAKRSSSSSNYIIGRQENGSDVETGCSAFSVTTTWTQFTCTFTTGATINGSSNLYIRATTSTVATVYIDGVTLVAGASALAFNAPARNIQVDAGYGDVTLNGSNTGELQAWQSSGAQLTAARSRAAVVTRNGFVYALGGGSTADGDTVAGSNNVQYARINADGTLDSFTNNANNLSTAVAGAGAAVVNGYVYVVGGKTGNADTTGVSTVQFAQLNSDGSTGTWTTTTALPASRHSSAVVAYNGYIYVFGGFDSTGSSQGNVYYGKVNADGTITSWTTGTSLPAGYAPAGATASVANGYVYVMGGHGSGASTHLAYSRLATSGAPGTWGISSSSDINPLPASLVDLASTVMNGYLYVIGGNTGSRSSAVYYTPLVPTGQIGAWTTATSSLPAGRDNIDAVTVNGFTYVLGGDESATRASVLYVSGPRLRVASALDLVGASGGNLSESGTGGQLTAGDTNIVGKLRVQDTAEFTRDIFVGGTATFRDGNSTSAFAVLNATAVPHFSIDTSNSRVYIGNPTADSTGALLVLDTKNTSGDPTGVDGGMYYNSNTTTFRCYENSVWYDCLPRHKLVLGSDVTDSSGACTAVTVFTLPVTSGKTYNFMAHINYTASVNTNGSEWTVNGPTATRVAYKTTQMGNNDTTEFVFYGDNYNEGACTANTINNTSALNWVEGTVITSSSGNLTIDMASEAGPASITAKAGSTLEWW